MSDVVRQSTQVVIIGAGVSGLTVGALLTRCGIDFVMLERRSLQYIGERQRAGSVENHAARMFEKWELGDLLTGPPYDGSIEFRVDGKPRPFKQDLTGASHAPLARVIPQNVLMFNLIDFLKKNGADMRFEVEDVAIENADGDRPLVRFTQADGTQCEMACDFIAGCDGFQGVSRASIPDGVLTRHEQDYGMSWLNLLAETPPRVVMAISEAGYAAQYPRRDASRIYLQCLSTDTVEDWPDERIWAELRKRLGEPDMPAGAITDKLVFPLRSVVFEPMQYGRLFLVGDSAHIILPVAGKGMNLALFDAEIFALAVNEYLTKGSRAGLDQYSDTCLPRTWLYQEYSTWVSEMLHDPSIMTGRNSFERKIAAARLDKLFSSANWARAYSELLAGLA
ncbi:MAG: 4-hydroxybenzoate 3-monooxygenase [Novosphingobium sp.]|nr:4-hydroxybenzoate 3-monooxygenase [Novosphingobium sp.]